MKEITFYIDDEKRTVKRRDYVTAKTKSLIEFGYPKLTEQEVDDQITAIQEGGKLTVIGMFMSGEIVV